MKALVVDDESQVLEDLKFYIKMAAKEIGIFPVIIVLKRCLRPADGIAAVQKEAPDILFLDYSLFDGNGAEIAKWIDANYQRPITVATHTLRSPEEARRLFGGAKCVTHFLGRTPSERSAAIKAVLAELAPHLPDVRTVTCHSCFRLVMAAQVAPEQYQCPKCNIIGKLRHLPGRDGGVTFLEI